MFIVSIDFYANLYISYGIYNLKGRICDNLTEINVKSVNAEIRKPERANVRRRL